MDATQSQGHSLRKTQKKKLDPRIRRKIHASKNLPTPSTSSVKPSSENEANPPKKRKISQPSKSESAVGLSDLPWRPVQTGSIGIFDGEGGMMDLEEVEGVDVEFLKEDEGKEIQGTSVRFLMSDAARKKESNERKRKLSETNVSTEEKITVEGQEIGAEVEIGDDEWTGFGGAGTARKDEAGEDGAVGEDGTEDQSGEEVDEEEETISLKKVFKAEDFANAEWMKAPFDDSQLPEWKEIPLLPPLKRALLAKGFLKPTDIQRRSLGATLVNDDLEKDIIGIAETGSGKTLAYSLPILQYILSEATNPASPSSSTDTPALTALVVCPTRELALQVKTMLSSLLESMTNLPHSSTNPAHPPISLTTLTGGLSIHKQVRLLSFLPQIVIATPGRLWEIVGEDDSFAKRVKGVKFLVVDEADRMVEGGHFRELEGVFGLVRRKVKQGSKSKGHEKGKGKGKAKGKGKEKEVEQDAEEVEFQDDFLDPNSATASLDSIEPREDMRTYVFSATMSKELQRNLKKAKRGGWRNRGDVDGEDKLGKIGDLLMAIDFRDPDPEIIDLTPEGRKVSTLKECKVDCLVKEKDLFLYYFLLRYPGRTLVFLSAIDGIRRLQPILTNLKLQVISLHSGMQQKARLKSLDKFRSQPHCILLATDVASRGLDVPSVDHVVHYQLPRSADVYVHRSGRTARAGKEGLSLQICGPDEKRLQRGLMKSLSRENEIPDLPVEYSILEKLRERLDLAREIDSAQHKLTKEAHDENWLKQTAEALDVPIDSDMDLSDMEQSSSNPSRTSRRKANAIKQKTKDLRERLDGLLSKPVMVKGISARYITSGARTGFVSQMVDESNHEVMLGLDKSTAFGDVKAKSKEGKKKKSESK